MNIKGNTRFQPVSSQNATLAARSRVLPVNCENAIACQLKAVIAAVVARTQAIWADRKPPVWRNDCAAEKNVAANKKAPSAMPVKRITIRYFLLKWVIRTEANTHPEKKYNPQEVSIRPIPTPLMITM